MKFSLKYQSVISLDAVPVQWIPKFELFNQDLPNFPQIYVHYHDNEKRLFGFPVSVNTIDFEKGMCVPKIKFLCNKDIENDEELKNIVKHEISERFGLTKRISKQDIIDACKGDSNYEEFFSKLWDDAIKIHHGDSIPYGKYYEEFYSILRFVSAWNTAGRGGRQQELRQVYWFLREYGEKISVEISDYGFYEFFLLPTYSEVKSESFHNFPKFLKLWNAVKKIWDLEFTNIDSIKGTQIRSMHKGKSWVPNRDKFVKYLNTEHVSKNNLTADEAHEIGLLVDMFDRLPTRAAGFVWSIMSISTLDYENWTEDFLDEFYLKYFDNTNTVAIYPKVVSCFLQQGFSNQSAIPMDSWIFSFVKHTLGIYGPQKHPEMTIKSQKYWEHEEFFSKFTSRAKLERLIWLVAQSKKVNMNSVFDMLWCIRFGTTGDNGELRQQNPIACYQCELKEKCVGYSDIQNEMAWIVEGDVTDDTKNNAENEGCSFICSTTKKVPKKIQKLVESKSGKKWLYIDEFSGLRMKPSYVINISGKHSISDLMKEMSKHVFDGS